MRLANWVHGNWCYSGGLSFPICKGWSCRITRVPESFPELLNMGWISMLEVLFSPKSMRSSRRRVMPHCSTSPREKLPNQLVNKKEQYQYRFIQTHDPFAKIEIVNAQEDSTRPKHILRELIETGEDLWGQVKIRNNSNRGDRYWKRRRVKRMPRTYSQRFELICEHVHMYICMCAVMHVRVYARMYVCMYVRM